MAGQASGGQNLTPNRNVSAPAGFGGDRWGANGGGITPMAGSKPIAATLADGETATNLQLGAVGGISIGGAGLTLSTQTIPVTNGSNAVGPSPVAQTSAVNFLATFNTNTNRYIYSQDGVTWNVGTFPASNNYNGMAYGGSTPLWIVMTGSRVTVTSVDGINWAQNLTELPNTNFWQDVAWSPTLGLFVAVASTGAIGAQVATSPDGHVWTLQTASNNFAWQWVLWSERLGLFIASVSSAFQTSNTMSSPNGVTWTAGTSISSSFGVLVDPGAGYDVFALGPGASTYAASANGLTWASKTTGSFPSGANTTLPVFSINGVVYALSSSRTYRTTAFDLDTTGWTLLGTFANNNPNIAAYSAALKVAAITSGGVNVATIVTTKDGINYQVTGNLISTVGGGPFIIRAAPAFIGDGVGYYDGRTNAGVSAGSVSGTPTIAGQTISALAFTDAANAFGFGPAGNTYVLALAGVVPQSTIKSVTFNTSAGPTTFNSAGAIFGVYTNPPGSGQKFSIWLWPTTDTKVNAFGGAASTTWTIVTSTMLVGNQNVMSNESIGVLNRQLDDSALPAGPTNQG